MYSNDMRVWNRIFQLIAKDLASAERDGIDLGSPHGVVFPVVVGNKGDWSYLVT